MTQRVTKCSISLTTVVERFSTVITRLQPLEIASNSYQVKVVPRFTPQHSRAMVPCYLKFGYDSRRPYPYRVLFDMLNLLLCNR